MIRITLNKKTYRGVYRWDDITLKQFCDLAAIPIPESYEAFIRIDGNVDFDQKESIDKYIDSLAKISDNELNEVFPAFYREVIKCLSNIPYHLAESLSIDQATELYDYYFKPFVLSLIFHIPVIHFMTKVVQYTPDEIKSFRIGLQKFYLPRRVRIMDQDIPLADEPVVSYIEASDLFRGMRVTKDDVNRLSLFMSIYCRKKNEKYDEAIIIKRQNLFMRVPMSVVWSVFFYTLRRLPESEISMQLFGSLPLSIRERVTKAAIYRDLAAVVSSMNVPVTEDLEQSGK